MAQSRVYYPIHAVGLARLGVEHDTSGYTAVQGLQSVSYSTSFNLEQVFQLGQLELYENIENLPDVEITLEKVIDGYGLIQHLATPTATASNLGGRFNDNRCMLLASYYDIAQETASGIPLASVVFSGCYVSSLGITIPIEGNITENVTLVCNDKIWYTGGLSNSPFTPGTYFTPTGSPITSLSRGGVQRRENVDMDVSLWPLELPGISGDGKNPLINGQYASHIQNVTISTTLARTDLLELGSKNPYFRYAEFPTEVTCAIETIANEFGDNIDAINNQDNITDQRILVYLDQGVTIDLGTKNKLSSIDTAGGDTGGGNVSVTYNYSNFNSFKVLHPSGDPAGLSA